MKKYFITCLMLVFIFIPGKVLAKEYVYDIVLFFGQSNMTGMDTNHYNAEIVEDVGFEYLYNTNELKPINDNVHNYGEYLKYNPDTDDMTFISEDDYSLQKSKESNIIPSFAKNYYDLTGHRIIAVLASNGGEEIAHFLPHDRVWEISLSKTEALKNQYIYEAMVKKYNSAVSSFTNYMNEFNTQNEDKISIGSKFYISFQGEQDTAFVEQRKNLNNKYTSNDYYERFLEVHNRLKEVCGIEFGAIIETSYRLGDDKRYGVDEINKAQKKLISDNNDILLGSEFPYNNYISSEDDYEESIYQEKLNESKKYMKADLTHYNYLGLSKIGEQCANNVSDYLMKNINWLTSLSVNDTEVLENNIFNYTLKFSDDISSLKINASLSSQILRFVDGYGPRNIDLVDGLNEFLIKVENTNNHEIKTYSFKIILEKNNNQDDNIEENTKQDDNIEEKLKDSNENVDVQNTSSNIPYLIIIFGTLIIALGIFLCLFLNIKRKNIG